MNRYTERITALRKEALDSLYNKPVRSTMLERMRVLTEADREVQGLPQALQIGKGTLYIARHVSKPVNRNDILLGRIPEVVPDDSGEKEVAEFAEKYPDGKACWQWDGGHTTFAWEELLNDGLLGLKARTQARLSTAMTEGAEPEVIQLLNGKIMLYDAYITYISDYAEAAEAAGLSEEAEICRFLTANAPKTFRQALQLFLLVGNFFSAYTVMVSALSYGRLDQMLLPYYLRDLKAGVMTREEAISIVEDFYCKNNLILGRGEHQMATVDTADDKNTGWLRNPMYDSPQYVVLAGYPDIACYRNKTTPTNPLTQVFLEAFNSKFKNPVLVYRHSRKPDSKAYKALSLLVLDNASILNYNDETMIPAYIHTGFTEADAVQYTVHACNWPDVPGKYVAAWQFSTDMAYLVRAAVMDGDDKLRRNFTSIDEIYQQVFEDFRLWIRSCFAEIRECKSRFPDFSGGLRNADCFMSGSADSIYPIYSGGIQYTAAYHQIRYIGSGIDAMAAMDWLVFNKKVCSLEKLAVAMAADFEGYEDLRITCRNAPKYGDDSEFSNSHVRRLMEGIIRIAEEETHCDGVRDIYCFNTTINDSNHRWDRGAVGATADGRRRGELLSENMSPASRIKEGSLTALFNSVSQLPLDHMCCGALNVKVRRNLFKGEKGLDLFQNMQEVFFEKGGMQTQWSFVDTAELRDAQQNPEKYKDLLVRVTGYSAIFVDMSPEAQDEMIIRSEMG